jgi:Family of unknown function (DUF6263)
MNTQIRVVATTFAATLSLTAAPGSAFGQDITLQYHWTKGEEVKQRVVFQSTSTVSGLPDNVAGEVDTSLSQVVRTVVDDVAPDGTATLRSVFESIRWETRTPRDTMVFDTESSDPANSSAPAALKDMLTALVGQTLVVVVAPSGQVQKVDGMSRIVEKAAQSANPDPSTASLVETLKSNFSDDQLRNLLTRGSIQFPDRPLRLGDTWDGSVTMTNPVVGDQKTTTVFTLKDVDNSSGSRVATIATRVTTQNTGEPKAGVAGLKMRVTGSSGEGEMIFDVTNGRLLRSTTRVTALTDMSMNGPGGNVMNLQSKSTSTMSVELQPSK